VIYCIAKSFGQVLPFLLALQGGKIVPHFVYFTWSDTESATTESPDDGISDDQPKAKQAKKKESQNNSQVFQLLEKMKNISNGPFPIKGDVSILPGLFGHAT
jgi:hypothetical protein